MYKVVRFNLTTFFYVNFLTLCGYLFDFS